MDAFEYDDGDHNVVKHQNSDSIRCLPKIKSVFRVIETCLILVFLTSVSTRLPLVVKIAGEYFHQFMTVLVSPLFIFLLSNVIVLTLFFKSHIHHQQYSQISMESHLDFRQELIKNGDDTRFAHESSINQAEEGVVFQDEQTIVQVIQSRESSSENSTRAESTLQEDDCSSSGKQQRRVADAGQVDQLSNEEFKRAIEAFIARQIKFHQQEKGAILLHGAA